MWEQKSDAGCGGSTSARGAASTLHPPLPASLLCSRTTFSFLPFFKCRDAIFCVSTACVSLRLTWHYYPISFIFVSNMIIGRDKERASLPPCSYIFLHHSHVSTLFSNSHTTLPFLPHSSVLAPHFRSCLFSNVETQYFASLLHASA